LWFSKPEEGAVTPTELPNYSILIDWTLEMSYCEKVDPQNKSKYLDTGSEIAYVRLMRLGHFVRRHKLWDMFLAEDAAGKR
jgi:hypothetical protein